MIVQCRVCGFTVDAKSGIPVACPACGARSVRTALRVDELTPEGIDLIMSAIPDAAGPGGRDRGA
jgi:hypothetical protein